MVQITKFMRFQVLQMKKQKKSRGSFLTKQLISKIYYSRTQQTYLKRYGNNNSYAHQLAEFINTTDKKKLNKIVEEVRSNNDIFHRYLLNRNIARLNAEDVLDFEQNFQNEQIRESGQHSLSQSSYFAPKSTLALRKLNSDIVRIGFMMLLQQLRNEKVNHFINEVKCAKETIRRENDNLIQLGYEYAGIENMYRHSDLIQEIQREQKENGAFKLIGGKIRQETSVVENASAFLKSIVSK